MATVNVHFVIPLFNKGKSLREDVNQLTLFLSPILQDSFEVVLCDDGSTDDTRRQAEAAALANPQVRVMGYAQNKGRGYAIKYAGNNCGGEYLIYLDLDFSKTTSMQALIRMLEYLREHDVVIGSRFLPDSKTMRLPVRDFVSRVHRFIIRRLLPGLAITDVDVGFKGIRLSLLKELSGYSQQNRWSWDMELLVLARSRGVRIKEFAIDWNEKHDGYDSAVDIVRDSIEEFRGIWDVRNRFFLNGKMRRV